MIFSQLKGSQKTEARVETLIQDYCFLLKASCHVQQRLRKRASSYLRAFTEIAPYLLVKKPVLTTLMDILRKFTLHDIFRVP
jgi:hypothetical protein